MSEKAKKPDSRRLLVIDDDLVQRTIISTVGAKIGFETIGAGSFEDASRYLHESRFDCITLDLSLGERSGAGLLHSIADFGRRVPIIIISGADERVMNSTVAVAQSLGLRAFPLSKPLDLAALRTSLTLMKDSAQSESGEVVQNTPIDVSDVARALERDEIYPEFQPKIHLASGKLIGCEALARWLRPGSGLVRPDQFIAVAEQGQLMAPLTERLLFKASQACVGIAAQYSNFALSVNLSPLLLSDPLLPRKIDEILARTKLPSRALILEISERAAMADVTAATEMLVQLRLKGVGISLDDFGTGASSLTALAQMPFNELKIDQTFIRDCDGNSGHWKFVRACVLLGHEFGMKVVAEGMEHIGLRKRLSEIGCDFGQGIAFSPALDIRAFKAWEISWRQNPTNAQRMPVAASA
jgi:EAL domain-containing protein (putative c-di-GMP-specific phosphodiesterase class I)/FixJ family two-component response regulator